MEVGDPLLYSTGCAVLYEGDVSKEWLDGAVDSGLWRDGPLEFTRRRRSTRSSEVGAIDGPSREKRLGDRIARHTLHTGRRYHRRVAHRVRTATKDDEVREMTLIGFELVVGSERDVPNARSGATGRSPDTLLPGVLVVHVDPPGNVAGDIDAPSALRFEHVDNLLARFFKFGAGTNRTILAELCADRASNRQFDDSAGFFAVSGPAQPPTEILNTGPEDLPVRLGYPSDTSSGASFTSYWLFSDVAPQEPADLERWSKDVDFYSNRSARPFDLDVCDADERRVRRSRALSDLRARPWALGEREDASSHTRGVSALAWHNWDVHFGRSGGGFAHSSKEGDTHTNRHRRDDLSSVYVDLIALEMLKDRVLHRFSEDAANLASRDNRGPDTRQECVEAWKRLVTFTSEYFGRSSGLEIADRDFLASFRSGADLDLDGGLERVQANLERLAEISRLEIDEERSERWHEQAQSEKRLNTIVGGLAAVVVPFTVVPPIVEWAFALPSVWAAGLGFGLTIPGVTVLVLALKRSVKPKSGD